MLLFSWYEVSHFFLIVACIWLGALYLPSSQVTNPAAEKSSNLHDEEPSERTNASTAQKHQSDQTCGIEMKKDGDKNETAEPEDTQGLEVSNIATQPLPGKRSRGPPAHLAKRLAMKSRSSTAKATVPSFDNEPNIQSVVVGGGCFWCVEAVMQRVVGVRAVVSGYMGGDVPNPSYEQVKAKESGHVEVVKVYFNALECTLTEILEIFMQCHDPTDEGGQGRDRGPQYRSTIFVSCAKGDLNGASQREVAKAVIEAVQEKFDKPIATQLREQVDFWPAESRHQDYYNLNKAKGYCRLVIHPKLRKVNHKKFKDVSTQREAVKIAGIQTAPAADENIINQQVTAQSK